MNTLLSHQHRSHHGNSSYRGNCNGATIKSLIEHFNPKTFVDCTAGSLTTKHLCQEIGIPYTGLDIHNGFDVTRHSILDYIGSKADMLFSHPPYHDMINYQKEREKHGLPSNDHLTDLSACSSYDEFLEHSQTMLLNQREATAKNGIYTTLIGDYRKKGIFHSIQSDYIQMLPKSELISVSIKEQFNCHSAFKNYNSKNFVPIMHEYLLIWKKSEATIYQVNYESLINIQKMAQKTWRNIIKTALINLGHKASLDRIYNEVYHIAKDKTYANQHWKAKVRQTLQTHFNKIDRAYYSLN